MIENIPNILIPQPAYISEYPQFARMADEQMKIFWPHSEISVEKDKQDLLVNLTPSEKHAVITALKLFTKYEQFAGTEYWCDRVVKIFPKPDIQRMAICFSHVELNSHAPFYAKINEELGLATEEFYNSYVEDNTLRLRMEFIDEFINNQSHLISLAAFSMIEGVALYSSFAFLKHFQSNGKNKLNNIVRGINMSVRDENLHSVGGSELFKVLREELKPSELELEDLHNSVKTVAMAICEHEKRIIEMLFSKGEIEGITQIQMNHFIESRVNTVMHQLGYKGLYDVKYNPIADWFYNSINNFIATDFFSGMGREYVRDWKEERLGWN